MQEVPKDVLLLLINRKSKHMLMDYLQEIIFSSTTKRFKLLIFNKKWLSESYGTSFGEH
jgi:hypothetical protein